MLHHTWGDYVNRDDMPVGIVITDRDTYLRKLSHDRRVKKEHLRKKKLRKQRRHK